MITHPNAVWEYLRGIPIREYTTREICDGMRDYWIGAHLDGQPRMMQQTWRALDRLRELGIVRNGINHKRAITWVLVECSTN